MLKYMCKREKEHRAVLARAVRTCYDSCTVVVRDMVREFQHQSWLAADEMRTGRLRLQQTQREMAGVKVAYEKMVVHATKAVEVG